MDPADELVEVLDADGSVVGVATRRQVRAENLWHRAVYLLVAHPDGRILIQRRSAAKDLWPGRWDLAAGGVVAAGEPWDEAARRELAEELGVTDAELEDLGEARFVDDECRVVGRRYRVVCEGPFHFADGEVVEARLVTPDELRRRLAADAFVADSPVLFDGMW